MPRARASLDYPDRKPDEPDLTDKQRSFIDHLLEELEAKNIPSEQLDALGKWQASALIDRLIAIRDGVPDKRVTFEPSEQPAPKPTTGGFPWLIVGVIVLVILLWVLM